MLGSAKSEHPRLTNREPEFSFQALKLLTWTHFDSNCLTFIHMASMLIVHSAKNRSQSKDNNIDTCYRSSTDQ